MSPRNSSEHARSAAGETADQQEAERAARESEEIVRCQNRVLELIARGAQLQETLTVLVRGIEELSPGMLGSILLLDSDGTRVRHGAAPSLPDAYVRAIDGESIGPQAGSCGTAAYRREPVIVEDIATDPLWEPYRRVALEYGLRACWSTPIFDGHGQVLGTFALYFREPKSPSVRHLRLIDITTYTAAIAIVHHRETQEATRREMQLAEAQRIAHLGSYEWDVESNDVRRSEELCRIFGVRPGEFPPTFEGIWSASIPRIAIEPEGSSSDPFATARRSTSRSASSVRTARSASSEARATGSSTTRDRL